MTKAKNIAGAALLALLPATPALSSIVINIHDSGAIQPAENVLFTNGATSSFNGVSGYNEIPGTTNAGTTVLFQGDEALTAQASGQARLTGSADGNLDLLQIVPVAPQLGFQAIEFLLSPQTGGGPQVDFITSLFLYDQNNVEYAVSNVAFVNGNNWFSASGTNGDYITRARLELSGTGAADIRQIRIDGVGVVPEPAAWAMMITGFGLVGSAMRRRRAVPRVLA